MPSFMERKRAELAARGIDPARLPPGQYVTDRFPVLHLGVVPDVDLGTWKLTIGGDAVTRPVTYSWPELTALPSTEVTVDIHCVTKWSKFDMTWHGVALADVLAPAGPSSDAATLLAWDAHGYSANLPVAELQANVALVAWAVDGDPLEAEHGAPLRLVVPHLYFWKSVKWLRRIELWRDPDVLGFWERNGYHEHGDPFREQRHWGDDE
jgi:DMSO/TMAO reductase YedYZ molybdopterin-dependent catalytic subunit